MIFTTLKMIFLRTIFPNSSIPWKNHEIFAMTENRFRTSTKYKVLFACVKEKNTYATIQSSDAISSIIFVSQKMIDLFFDHLVHRKFLSGQKLSNPTWQTKQNTMIPIQYNYKFQFHLRQRLWKDMVS